MNSRASIGAVCGVILALVSSPSKADQTARVNGITDNTPSFVAFQNATIVMQPGQTVEHATLVIRNGLVEAVQRNNQAPQGARIIDATGFTIYPGFIDAYSDYGISKAVKPEHTDDTPLYNNHREGGNAANDAIHAQQQWFSEFETQPEQAKQYIEQGFTSVQTARQDGIFQGQAVTVSLANNIANDVIYRANSRQFGSFDKGSSRQQYPSSLMGSIALIRQTLSDADWYRQAQGKQYYDAAVEFNAALKALVDIDKQGMIFRVNDEKSLLRADKLFDQFGVPVSYVASGYEYDRIDAVQATNAALIVPLNFPAAPDVDGRYRAIDVDLAKLRHWERAPSNPAVIANAGMVFAFTLTGLEKPEQFWHNLRRAMPYGLSEKQALAALTTVPAKLAGIDDKAGKLVPGYKADFVISRGDIFQQGEIYSVWLQGQEHVIKSMDAVDFAGHYQWPWGSDQTAELTLKTSPSAELSLTINGEKWRTDKLQVQDQQTTWVAFAPNEQHDAWRLALLPDSKHQFTLELIDPQGQRQHVIASRKPLANEEPEQQPSKPTFVSKLTYPNRAFGLPQLPPRQNVVIRHATVWTATADGVLKDVDVYVENGRFSKIGKALSVPAGTQEIDAAGLHLTPGIIDEHSHIAIDGGVNEGSEAITSEVRIGDVVNPDDPHIYYSLAGGTTTAQLLHGSANPIGGQAQVIKLRWGATAEQMKFDAAPPSIKFALGENVKQSNWGDDYTVRYPQTRLGVETIMRDGFQQAIEYQQRKVEYQQLSSAERRKTAPPRPDQRLEALLDILNSKMFIHSHSYVASEILMLMNLAEEFGFRVNTFTHILEGYKVADEMAKHGASGSTFADWWAYKFEVYDAIPQNACLMQQRGVLTSINSDSEDLQRRLNTEAAKSVRYCGMSEHDALKMITINPAKQLHIDEHVGSIEVGKDADFVLWNHHPLSAYAQAQQTWINGRKYFDRDIDKQRQQQVAAEKNALIQKLLATPLEQRAGAEHGYKEAQPLWRCETEHDVWLHQAQHNQLMGAH
ncbi:amidohydrolase [Idiomarina tyrosinivorans]|uniref:Amidohydrolase n=1 Tax=Idiomarina tyrosinivorans TaxID=1445662 RepID=A0A432ZLH1_9GAMM|nr:amidohydrolase family protein [Idiomarina tyrosinivorans]RUO78875.1 amidohydrolase [Idiomarina tyrosinivorans]